MYEKLSRQFCTGAVLRLVDALGDALRGQDSQVLSDDERLAVAAVNAANAESRIRELEYELKIMTELRDRNWERQVAAGGKLKVMTEDLREFGYHRRKCLIMTQMAGPRPIVGPCDCGWAEACVRAGFRKQA